MPQNVNENITRNLENADENGFIARDISIIFRGAAGKFYYFDFGCGTLIRFPEFVDKFVTFSMQNSNFGEGTFPMFRHPGEAYDI